MRRKRLKLPKNGNSHLIKFMLISRKIAQFLSKCSNENLLKSNAFLIHFNLQTGGKNIHFMFGSVWKFHGKKIEKVRSKMKLIHFDVDIRGCDWGITFNKSPLTHDLFPTELNKPPHPTKWMDRNCFLTPTHVRNRIPITSHTHTHGCMHIRSLSFSV